jgi:superfamily II DNA or RNA helicase
MVSIKVISPVYSECSDIHAVKDCLKYESVFWKQGPYKKTRSVQPAYMCSHRKGIVTGTLLTGFIPRVESYCQRNGIALEIQPILERIKLATPNLPGIDFREDQLRLIGNIKDQKRGLIVSPTGSGKTVIAGGLISMLPKSSKAIFVVHTSSLFLQTIEEFKGWFGPVVGFIGNDDFILKRINVVMAQSARSIIDGDDKWTANKFIDLLSDADLLVVDEAHHVGNETGHYSGIMKNCLAPIRIGFTATPAKGKEALVCEGYLGPEIGKFSMSEGIENGILAKPHVKLIPVPINTAVAEKRRYNDIYKNGIILNKQRNRLIAKEISIQNRKGKSVLVMITDVEHGQADQIMEIAKEVYNIDVEFVQGSTEGIIREKIKSQLESKETMAVISTSVWFEGINIKSVDVIILAYGGKSDIRTLQAIGRGLRTTEIKKDILLVDFLDPYNYLSSHTIQRITIYVKMGWL